MAGSSIGAVEWVMPVPCTVSRCGAVLVCRVPLWAGRVAVERVPDCVRTMTDTATQHSECQRTLDDFVVVYGPVCSSLSITPYNSDAPRTAGKWSSTYPPVCQWVNRVYLLHTQPCNNYIPYCLERTDTHWTCPLCPIDVHYAPPSPPESPRGMTRATAAGGSL